MTLIVFIALIAALVVAVKHSPQRALLDVYLPFLLLIPSTFHATISTSPNFNQLAAIAIFLLCLPRYLPKWRPSVCDIAIIALVSAIAVSEYANAGYKEAQNLTFVMLTSAALPYFMARWLISPQGLDVPVARRVVAVLAVVTLINAWEFRFGVNLFHTLPGLFFPGQGAGWVTTFRHGVARTAGPFSHAILAGMGLVIAFRLQQWLAAGNHWEARFRHLPGVGVSKAKVLTWILAVGVVMTLARGPWLGAAAGAMMVAIGRARHPQRMVSWIGGLLLVGGLGVWLGLQAYLEVQPGQALTMSQESAMYRKELMSKYMDIVYDHLVLGWGRNTWPKVPGMPSIDNYYLLLSLMHGLLATGLLLFVMLWLCARLLRRGLQQAVALQDRNALSFVFLGIVVAVFISLGTVYLGESMMPFFFFMVGWAEGHLQTPWQATQTEDHAPVPRAPFRAVIA